MKIIAIAAAVISAVSQGVLAAGAPAAVAIDSGAERSIDDWDQGAVGDGWVGPSANATDDGEGAEGGITAVSTNTFTKRRRRIGSVVQPARRARHLGLKSSKGAKSSKSSKSGKSSSRRTPAFDPDLTIIPSFDPDCALIFRPYFVNLVAANLPVEDGDVVEFGADVDRNFIGIVRSPVTAGTATARYDINIGETHPGSITVEGFVTFEVNGDEGFVSDSLKVNDYRPRLVTTVDGQPGPQFGVGNAGQWYDYEFTVVNLPPCIETVRFQWTFNDGSPLQARIATVAAGSATVTQLRDHPNPGTFPLLVQVFDADDQQSSPSLLLDQSQFNLTFVPPPTLTIVPGDPNLAQSPGGVPGQDYFFILRAENIPETAPAEIAPAAIRSVRFRFRGFGDAGAVNATVQPDGTATANITLSDGPGNYTLMANVSGIPGGQVAYAASKIFISNPQLTVTPSKVLGLAPNEDQNFTFTLTNVPAGIGSVDFFWNWGDFTGYAGEDGQALDVSVTDGAATAADVHAYDRLGPFTVTVAASLTGDVEDDIYAFARVVVGPVVERSFKLTTCNSTGEFDVFPKPGMAGATHLDRWDISGIPAVARVDFEHNSFCTPDRFAVWAKAEDVVETGWVGCSNYSSLTDYPGGVFSSNSTNGPGFGFYEDIFFNSATPNEFVFTSFGPDAEPDWLYRLSCFVESGDKKEKEEV